MSAGQTPEIPETSFEFIAEWFERAAKSATAKGNRDSAQLWRDGLQHLMHLNAERNQLKMAKAELARALGLSAAALRRALAVMPCDDQFYRLTETTEQGARAVLAKNQGATA